MAVRRARAGMLALSALLLAGQVADLAWPRDDDRAGSPASAVVAVSLSLLLAVYPNGRFVPRWTAVVAPLCGALFIANLVAGPDVAERFLWPLPLAPFLLALVIGGQGYRYLRRATADEREAVRWPLLGLLLLLTITVPADAVSVALTGATLDAPPALAAAVQVAFLLPGAGFVAGVIAPRTELVDRLLAGWIALVTAAAGLGAVFAAAFTLAGLWLASPWPAWIGAAAVAAASVVVIPLARRAGRAVVFRGRRDVHEAIGLLNARLRSTLDVGDVPAEVARAVADATGSQSVTLRRWGQKGIWAAAGGGASGADFARGDTCEVSVTHLGLPIATLSVLPRPAESALASADGRIIEAMAAAAAPALHGARLASAFPELTDRERQVLAGIVRGLPNGAIAQRLGVSSKTVANYVSIVLTKLRVPDKERAAELARRRSAEFG